MHLLRKTTALALMTLMPHMAHAGLEVCNATDVTQSIAIGYKSDEKWFSEGWWNANPGECVQPVQGNLKNRYYYVKAQADDHTFQPEDYAFCVTQEEFTIEGDEDCEGRGFTKSYFIEIDTGETATHFTKAITDRLSIPATAGPDTGGKPGGKSGGKAGDGDAAVVQPLESEDDPAQDPAQAPTENSVTVENGVIQSGLGPTENAEAFTKTGHFQTCEAIGGQYICSFHMEGWKFFAYESGPTPRAMLEAMAGLEPGTPVEVTGDILYYGDITAEIVAREVRPMPGTDPHGDILANLQGQWTSLEDPASGMTITGLELEDAYGEEALGVRYLQLADSCDVSGGAGPVLIQTNPEDQEPQCYMVARADGQNLDLIYFAKGNTLRYGRP